MYPYFELANIVMAYVLGSTIAGVRFGRGPAIVAAVANVLAFDFCFVPPRFTFSVADAQYIVTFAVMLIVDAGDRESHGERPAADARRRCARAAHGVAVRDESRAGGDARRHQHGARRRAARRRSLRLQGRGAAAGRERAAALSAANRRSRARSRSADLSIAQWVVDHGKRAGLGSDTLPAAPALYVPLSDERQRLGVLAVLPANRRRMLLPEQRHLLETFAGQLGLAMERAQLAEQAEAARVAAETESLRNTLLASISHDLRTPLAVIAGAGSTLAERGSDLDEASAHCSWRARSRPRRARCRSSSRTCST